MKYRRLLFWVKDPYSDSSDELFTKAVKENFSYCVSHCDDYRRICENLGISSPSDASGLPVIPTLLFKKKQIFNKGCIPLIKATSSGTSGRKSVVAFDTGGLLCGLKMVMRVSKLRNLLSPVPCHYIIMGYKHHRGNKTAVTKTAFGATFFTPALSRNYILTYKKGGYSPDFDRIIDLIVRHSRSRFPTRFMGFPAYTYFLLRIMDERKIYLKMPKDSRIMLGGGWKQFYAEQADNNSFYSLAEKVLGIKENDIIEFFGAVEHPILYCDCKEHHFHVPAYSRVIIRDVDTLKPLENGKTGLVNLITPMVKATPVLSVMTDDLGILHNGSECSCGLKTPFLEIVGRVAPEDIKTCAAGAEEIIKGVNV